MSSALSEAAEPTDTAADAACVAAITDLHVTFRRNGRDVHALRGVSLDIATGEILGLVGESGSGKSVLGFTMLGLLPQARVSGSVEVADTDMVTGDAKTLRKVRRLDLGAVFQDPMTSLNPTMRIGKQVAEAAGSDEEALKLLTAVGIPDPKRRFRAYPHELSGGLRQRVMIAIAIAGNPELIIADEPTTALDVTVQAQVLEALEAARNETGAAMVLITHDLGVIAGHVDRVCVMYAGKLVEKGSIDDVFYEPRMPYSLGLLGSLPRLDEAERERLTPIIGSPPSLVNLPPGCPFTPRCPLAQDICETDEPDLFVTNSPSHLAACHFHDRLVGMTSADLFGTTSIDTEGLTVADLDPAIIGPVAETVHSDLAQKEN